MQQGGGWSLLSMFALLLFSGHKITYYSYQTIFSQSFNDFRYDAYINEHNKVLAASDTV